MRIGFDAKRFFCNDTGLGNYSRTLLAGLINFYPEDEYHLFSPKLLHNENTEFIFHQKNTSLHKPEAGIKAYWRSFSIKKDLCKANLSLYHGLSNELPLGIEKTGIPSLVTIHDVIYKTYPDMFPYIDRQIYDLKFRNACQYANKVIAISESTKNDIVRLYRTHPDKIEVIYQGVNSLFYTKPTQEEIRQRLQDYILPSDFALYVGSINERKNLLGIVEAYRILPKSLRIPLVVIGNGRGYKEKVLRAVKKYGLSSDFIFLNNVRDLKLLQAFYIKAKMLLFPSFYEGFGLPICEASLSQTAVLTSKISSLPEAGGPHVFYVDPYSAESIAETMTEILSYSKEDLSFRCALAERYVQEKFDFTNILKQYHDLYKSI